MAIAAKTIRYIALISALTFVGIALLIGGDAINGRSDGTHYFLASHGRYTEVSRAVFQYSRIHAISAVALVLIALLASLFSRPGPTELRWQRMLILAFVLTVVLVLLVRIGLQPN